MPYTHPFVHPAKRPKYAPLPKCRGYQQAAFKFTYANSPCLVFITTLDAIHPSNGGWAILSQPCCNQILIKELEPFHIYLSNTDSHLYTIALQPAGRRVVCNHSSSLRVTFNLLGRLGSANMRVVHLGCKSQTRQSLLQVRLQRRNHDKHQSLAVSS